MIEEKIKINDKLINFDDIIEISELLYNNQNKNLPWGFSIVLRDHSVINVIGDPNKKTDESKKILSSYQMIKKHLFYRYYAM